MIYQELAAEQITEMIIARAADWPRGYGFAWYLFSEADLAADPAAERICMREAEMEGSVFYGLRAPDPLTLRDEAAALCFFQHGSPDLMLAIASGTEPWVASEALGKALKMPEERYMASLNAPCGSEAREQLVEKLRAALPTLIVRLRAPARRHKAEADATFA